MYNWSVIFLIRAVDTHSKEAGEMINEILLCKKSPDVGILFCLNTKIEYIKKLLPKRFGRSRRPNDEQTTVFLSMNDSRISEAEARLDFILEDKNFDIREEVDVKKVFKEKVLPAFRAVKYLLFTWDHGSVFGIFKDPPPDSLRLKSVQDESIIDTKTNRDSPFMPIEFLISKFIDFDKANKEQSARKILREIRKRYLHSLNLVEEFDENGTPGFDMLTAYELNEAIKWAFGIRKQGEGGIDVVCMMNCCMQFFDTGFALRETVNYLVAPETVMLFSGYNYSVIFEELFKDSKMNEMELSYIIVDSFKYKKFADRTHGERAIEETALFGNDLTFYSEAALEINELAKNLRNKITKPLELGIIRETRGQCTVMPSTSEYTIIDFFTYLELLFKNGSSGISPFYNKFAKELIPKITGKRFHIGNRLDINGDGKFIRPRSFSVFYAKNKNELIDFYREFIDELSENSTEFSQRFQWDNFVKEYLYRI